GIRDFHVTGVQPCALPISTDREALLDVLKDRFEKNMSRHDGITWKNVQAKLEANTEKLWSLHEMEKTGGEPDVVDYDKKTGEYRSEERRVGKERREQRGRQ